MSTYKFGHVIANPSQVVSIRLKDVDADGDCNSQKHREKAVHRVAQSLSITQDSAFLALSRQNIIKDNQHSIISTVGQEHIDVP